MRYRFIPRNYFLKFGNWFEVVFKDFEEFENWLCAFTASTNFQLPNLHVWIFWFSSWNYFQAGNDTSTDLWDIKLLVNIIPNWESWFQRFLFKVLNTRYMQLSGRKYYGCLMNWNGLIKLLWGGKITPYSASKMCLSLIEIRSWKKNEWQICKATQMAIHNERKCSRLKHTNPCANTMLKNVLAWKPLAASIITHE